MPDFKPQHSVSQPDAWMEKQLMHLLPRYPDTWFGEQNAHRVLSAICEVKRAEYELVRRKLPIDRGVVVTPMDEKKELDNAMRELVTRQLASFRVKISNGTIARPGAKQTKQHDSSIFVKVHMQKTFVVHLNDIHDPTAEIHRRLETGLLQFDKELHGIPIAFSQPQVLSNKVKISYSPPMVEVPSAYDVLLFTPRPNSLIQGKIVNFGNQGIDLFVFDLFNAQITYPRNAANIIPSVDPNDLAEGDILEFRIHNLILKRDYVYIKSEYDGDVKLVRHATDQEREATLADQQQMLQEGQKEEAEIENEMDGDSDSSSDEEEEEEAEESSEEEHKYGSDDSDSDDSSTMYRAKTVSTPEQPKKKKRKIH